MLPASPSSAEATLEAVAAMAAEAAVPAPALPDSMPSSSAVAPSATLAESAGQDEPADLQKATDELAAAAVVLAVDLSSDSDVDQDATPSTPVIDKKAAERAKKKEKKARKKAAAAKQREEEEALAEAIKLAAVERQAAMDTATAAEKESYSAQARQPRSISGMFMTAADLPTGLADVNPLRLARVYMDHDTPVKMGDGSPKQIPEAAMQCTDAAELMRKFGYGAGGFMGEVLFWKRHHGVLLGKQKWESHSDNGPDGDTAPMSELWEARWLFPSSAEAKSFHEDMLGASRGERGCGYMDGPDPSEADVPSACHERPDVFSSSEVGSELDGLVLSSNVPRPLPKAGGLHAFEVRRAPTHYLQQHSAVFVVDRVVAKLYVASGINSRDAKGRHIGVSPASFIRLIRVASETISRWLARDSATGREPTFEEIFEECVRAGRMTEAQYDRVTDELASGLKTEAELLTELATSTESGEETAQQPKARSHGSLVQEMGHASFSPGSKARISGLQSRTDLNGMVGEVMQGDAQSGRLTVKVRAISVSGRKGRLQGAPGEWPYELVRVKPANLKHVRCCVSISRPLDYAAARTRCHAFGETSAR